MASPFTKAEMDHLKALHARGLSMNQIAKDMHRGVATISRYAHKLNLDFSREETRMAVEARVTDLRERRARAAEQLAIDAEKLQAQIWTPYLAWNFGGRENSFNEHELPAPDAKTQLDLMRAVQIAWKTSMDLVEFSQGDPGEGARSLLGGLAKALSAAAEALPPDDDD